MPLLKFKLLLWLSSGISKTIVYYKWKGRNFMSLHYKLAITEPWTHTVKIIVNAEKPSGARTQKFFLPSWSPGSYLMREYSRHMSKIRVTNAKGEFLYFEKVAKGAWLIDWDKSDVKAQDDKFTIEYLVYGNEISVRTTHINLTHAFLHGPSIFVGLEGQLDSKVELAVEFPPCWTKVSTALKDISPKRQEFLYEAADYDELLDTPLEIGSHDTNGFRVEGIDHNLAFLNLPPKLPGDLRSDIKKIVERISQFWGEVPYESYSFIGHFFPKTYGGLEHLNSTALQFDPFEVAHIEGYRDFLGLVAHEYFHTWNVKRVRPIELGPFDYENENYTRMHWLTEGLTSFVDDLFVLNCDLSDNKYYLERLKKKINIYNKTPGRLFDSLEESSFDSWIKLYRPHENSKNSTVSYYLKGALAFFCLNALFSLQGKKIKDLTDLLWTKYKSNPKKGVTKAEVLDMIESIGGGKIKDEFEGFISTTFELPLEECCGHIGLKFEWDTLKELYWGGDWSVHEERLLIKNIIMDGPLFKAGLNHGDEILAAGGVRLLASNKGSWEKSLEAGKPVELLISRQGHLLTIDVAPESSPRELKSIEITNESLFRKATTL